MHFTRASANRCVTTFGGKMTEYAQLDDANAASHRYLGKKDWLSYSPA